MGPLFGGRWGTRTPDPQLVEQPAAAIERCSICQRGGNPNLFVEPCIMADGKHAPVCERCSRALKARTCGFCFFLFVPRAGGYVERQEDARLDPFCEGCEPAAREAVREAGLPDYTASERADLRYHREED